MVYYGIMSNVRISEPTHAALRCLAAEGGETMQAVLDKAVEEYRRRRFWDQVEAAATDFRKDAVAWKEELAERRAWDATIADGLEDS
jgi:hypothetical protein